jgi:hypothetical protein
MPESSVAKVRPARGMNMRKLLLSASFLLLALTPAGASFFGAYGFNGNDTGGIIPWSPAVAHTYRDIAAAHCANYNKVARITSVHAWYGDYVGFVCRFPRGYDPVKARYAPVVVVVRARG